MSRRPWLLALALAVALAAGSAGASTGSDATVPVATQDGPDYVFHRAHERMLFQTSYTLENNGSVICMPRGQCYCEGWLRSRGTSIEKTIAITLQWVVFALSVACLGWYAYQAWRATCGWEEVYVALIEMMKSIIEAFHEFDEPAVIYSSNGNKTVWLRYAEWLLTCPVILIHLSNLTGLKDDYSKRTMGLLVSDVGCIVWGATSAMCTGWTKILFFLISLSYGMYTYFHAAKVYIEAFHTVPKGRPRTVVRIMAWLFFLSWGMFPVLFVVGPEGFGVLSVYGSAIGHSILDLIAKNMWGVLGNYLRVKIHEHILLYGDIRKKTKINVAGEEMEVETMVDQEDEE
nr:light-activated cation selective ion channel [synthetic construct]